MPLTQRNLTLLGATGSIGESTLDVVGRHPDRFTVFALSANTRIDRLAQLCQRHSPRFAVVPDAAAASRLRDLLSTLHSAPRTEVIHGRRALCDVAAAPEVHDVMAAIVGAAGLPSALAAARAGKRILLANKEALVMAGRLFIETCQRSGAVVLPIDSEHNAVFQCLTPTPQGPGVPGVPAGVRRILLTASGGPFRQWSLEQMRSATAAQACAHPNWSMGRKISVDSATMMNKGLELIEAHFLFGLDGDALDVVVHPQSIVHSMVEYLDGSMLAQLGNPDMRVPIAHALAFPQRIDSGVSALDLARHGRLDFEPPDLPRFPCLRLAHEALAASGAAPCVLNAANEISVQAFLEERIRFTDIATVNQSVLDQLGTGSCPADLEETGELDARARRLAERQLPRCAA